MKCPRCDGVVIRQRTEWLCLAHGSFAHAIEARDIVYDSPRTPDPDRQTIADEIRDIREKAPAAPAALDSLREMIAGDAS